MVQVAPASASFLTKVSRRVESWMAMGSVDGSGVWVGGGGGSEEVGVVWAYRGVSVNAIARMGASRCMVV